MAIAMLPFVRYEEAQLVCNSCFGGVVFSSFYTL